MGTVMGLFRQITEVKTTFWLIASIRMGGKSVSERGEHVATWPAGVSGSYTAIDQLGF